MTSELVSALGPLGTRLGAERTLIPISPPSDSFFDTEESAVVRLLGVKVNCQLYIVAKQDGI